MIALSLSPRQVQSHKSRAYRTRFGDYGLLLIVMSKAIELVAREEDDSSAFCLLLVGMMDGQDA